MERRGLVCILFAVCITFLDASSSSARPSPTSTTVKPSPASTTVKPSPTSTTVKPSPTSTSARPSPTSTTVKPSPTSTTVKPSPTSTSVKPSPTSTTVIPDTFYYNCTEDGGIEIINDGGSLSNILINYLNQTSGRCADPVELSDGSFKLANCTLNSTVDIVLETTNGTNIIGGHHSKTFQIKCENVNIEPYFLNVTANEKVGDQSTPRVVNMATKSTPAPVSNLNMVIKDGTNPVTEASIGQALTIAIAVPDQTNIKPTICKATGNDKDVTLWQETGCQYDKELFGEKWENNGSDIINTMYGFRFVGESKSIIIICTVRVCPAGYRGNECHLGCTRKRKRMHHLSDDVTMEQATASLAIKDPLLTSGVERLGYELTNIIGLSAAVVIAFVNALSIHG